MKPTAWIIVALIAVLANVASAHEYKLGSLSIGHPWSRATARGAKVAAGYLTITNNGTASDRLMGGTFAAGGRVEVHEMSMDGGVMKMRALPEGIEIKPGTTVELKPGSFHLMLHDLGRQLAKGDKVAATLVFENAGTLAIEFHVDALGAGAPGGASSDPSGHMH